jgi:hypothetical protein
MDPATATAGGDTSTTTLSPAQKAVERLSQSIDSGDLYQALQLFKTQHARAKKRGDIHQAIELAYRGANLMLEKKEVNAGSELARDFVDLVKNLPEEQLEYPKILSEIVIIDSNFAKCDGEEASRERKRFLKQAIEFTSDKGDWTYGEPELHRLAALAALKDQDIMQASKHMLHSHKPEEFAILLAKWAKRGPDSERDLHVARAVLQLLCFENLRDGNALFKAYKAEFPDLDTPLMRFIGYLLRTLERDAYPLFQTLREKYNAAIARGNFGNATFDLYLDKIASVYYNKQKPSSGNFLESLLKGAF